MGYTPFEKLVIRNYGYKRNPVSSVTIPFNIAKKFKWENGDLILFFPFNKDSVELVNLNRCKKEYLELKVIGLIDLKERIRNGRLKKFNHLPKKIRMNFVDILYKKKDLSNEKRIKININKHKEEMIHKLLAKENKRLTQLESEKRHFENRLPHLKREIKESEERIKQLASV